MKKLFVFLFLSSAVITAPLAGCTDFLLRTEKGECIIGRTMEYSQVFDTTICIQPRGEHISSEVGEGRQPTTWTSSYGYTALMMLPNLFFDGFNEKGLSLGVLLFPEGVYPSVDWKSPKPIMNFLELPKWILGNFVTVEDVSNALKEVQITSFDMPFFAGTPKVHLALHDATGKSIVIEFNEGRVDVFYNPVDVLTNSPAFPWHLQNLSNYINLQASNVTPQTLGDLKILPTGQGTGWLGLPGDWTPPSRFIRMVSMLHSVQTPKDIETGVIVANHLLNAVDIPYGSVRNTQNVPTMFTQWVVIKDITNRRLYYRAYNHLNLQMLEMSEEKIQEGATPQLIPIPRQEVVPQ